MPQPLHRFAIAAALVLAAATRVGAVSGDLDPAFGAGGTVLTGIGKAFAVAVQPNGKLVAAGDGADGGVAIARYDTRGELDPSFGKQGVVTTDFGSDVGHARALMVQADGKVVVAGYLEVWSPDFRVDHDFLVQRYDPDGTLDATFGNGGTATLDFGGNGEVRFDRGASLAVQSDGRIVAAGTTQTSVYDPAFALVRYLADGTRDPTFGSDGIVVTPGLVATASALALAADGRLVVAGTADDWTSPKFALARYETDGALDDTFGTGGIVRTDFNTQNTSTQYSSAYALALQSDGKIIAAGQAYGGFGLVRYDSDGSLDPTFGTGGKVRTQVGAYAYARGVALGTDGTIVTAGYTSAYPAPGNDFALARYHSDGALDPTFGSGGTVVTDFFGGQDLASASALQADGKLVVVGHLFDRFRLGYDFALARYLLAPGCTGGCNPCEICDRALGCIVPIELGCHAAASGKSVLDLRHGPHPGENSMRFTWKGSAAVSRGSFGHPHRTTGGDVSVCVFDHPTGVPAIKLGATAPAAAQCDGSSCWTATRLRYLYHDGAAAQNGLARLILEGGTRAGRGRIRVDGTGPDLDAAQLPLTPPVIVRVRRSNASACWESVFSAPHQNEASRFRARSD